MEIWRNGSRPSVAAINSHFTGAVRTDPAFTCPAPARARGTHVTFEPGARTYWHRHGLGQILIVTAGSVWVQREGAPVEAIRMGDVVWIAPGERHWHGATDTTAMTHLAISEQLEGQGTEWAEEVARSSFTAPAG